MYKSATKCNETICKWCKNKHGASKIIDTFETYHITEEERACFPRIRKLFRIETGDMKKVAIK
jgi:hypothetical protein